MAAVAVRRLVPSRFSGCRPRHLAATTHTLRPSAPLIARPQNTPSSCSIFNLAAAALNHATGNSQPHHSISTIRTLPYAAGDLFRLIADVDAYEEFLPHCTESRVTHWRGTTSTGGGLASTCQWPARADLTVGWGPLSQTYSSRVYCAPGCGVVEAVSGQHGEPTLTAAERAEIGLDAAAERAAAAAQARAPVPADDTFESLVTRWKVTPIERSPPTSPPSLPSALTRVELRIRFQFRNPLYQLAAAQVGQEMATKMIEAFERRAADQLGPRRGRL